MKRLKLNNKGFSLVELICAVALLAAVVVPLMLAFVTSSNMSAKAVKYTEATMAAENILKTVEARPATDFANLNETDDGTLAKKELLSEMLSKGATDVTFANAIDSGRIPGMNTVLTDDNEFVAVLQGVKSGNSSYDAVVTFNRGALAADAGTKNSSYGLREINSQTIAEYDKMDAVFSQPYTEEANPDIRADTELKAQAASRFGKAIDEDPYSKTREIVVNAYTDDETGKTITCYVDYTYTYTYKNVKEGETTYRTKSIMTTYTYAIFPGGYKYNGSLISIYIMYYPWQYSADSIIVKNNAENGADEPINLSVYLYMQKPYACINQETRLEGGVLKSVPTHYQELEFLTNTKGFQIVEYQENEVTGEKTAVIKNYLGYTQDLIFEMPPGYQIDKDDPDSEDEFKAETLVYTNANKYGTFNYYVGSDGYYSRLFADTVDGNLVKRKANKLIYNVTVEIYEAGTVTVDPTDHTITVAEEPVYTAVGSKSQK